MGDLQKISPILDFLTLIEIEGKYIIEALENSVSRYPSPEGRFSSFSGIKFCFDKSKNPGNRIIKESIKLDNGEQFFENKSYRVATRGFLSVYGFLN